MVSSPPSCDTYQASISSCVLPAVKAALTVSNGGNCLLALAPMVGSFFSVFFFSAILDDFLLIDP